MILQEPGALLEAAHLPEWEGFYVIMGSSAAALTGLQFVVMTLLVEEKARNMARAVAAFGTPTIIHFASVVFLSGILTAPWGSLTGPEIGVGACGVAGLVYAGITVRRIVTQKIYTPVFEDWLWHVVLPGVAYSAALVAAVGMLSAPAGFLFLAAAAALVLLFAGIHNAWDTVVFLAQRRVEAGDELTSTSDGPPTS